MALNKYMHPRNVYKDRKPNFKKLAEKYEEFHKHVLHDDHGTVQIDFKVRYYCCFTCVMYSAANDFQTVIVF